jgi:tripartite-type tricarboxylate transporter receptor subunit TctC
MGLKPISYALGWVAITLSLSGVLAQDAYPSKPIKLIVPLAAGGGIDFTARTTAQKLSDVLGQQVVVENQGGAGGTLGVNAVARAAPDGYTLLYHSVTGVVSSVVGKDLPYDWLRDLTPVSLVTRSTCSTAISLRFIVGSFRTRS